MYVHEKLNISKSNTLGGFRISVSGNKEKYPMFWISVSDYPAKSISGPSLFARENGVVILLFPPHCSHTLELLDVSLYGPFKTYFRSAQSNFMTSNADKTINIHDLSCMASQAFNKAFIKANIPSWFKKNSHITF